MDRKDFLKGVSLAGMASLIPFKSVLAQAGTDGTESSLDECALIPSETEGPFPLDLTANTTFFRSDVREDRAGVRLNLKMKILGVNNCGPMSNVRVNVWMCDKDGLYSGYSNSMNPGQAGKTYLRGYQITNSEGEVDFTTIFPGWYSGRICHIHFQVYVSSSYSVVSQFSFDVATKNALYAANSSIYTKGADPMTFTTDNIFEDGYSLQLATLTANSDGSYSSYIEVAVQGNGLGIGYTEKQNALNFKLGNVYPNPTSDNATLSLLLLKNAEVYCEIFDINGRNLGEVYRKQLYAGEHNIQLALTSLNLRPANYVYQIKVSNSDGVYSEARVLTVR